MNVLMFTHFRTIFFVKKAAAIFLSLLLCQPGWSQSVQNQMMSFEGSLTDTSGNPIDLQDQQLYFYITANDSFGNKCVLFAESSSSSGDSQGTIAHKIGNGLAVTSPVSYNNILSSSVFSGIASGKLADGSGTACSVAVNETRFADVYSVVLDVAASITLGSAPYSQYAMNASLLNGKSDVDFLLAATVSGGTTGQVLSRNGSGFSWVDLSTTDGVTSIDLGSASATGILAPARLPSYSGDVFSASGSLTMSVIALRGVTLSTTMPVSGQALVYDGSQWEPLSVPTPLVAALNLSDVASAGIARTNLGLGSLATQSTVDLSSQVTGLLQESNLPSFNGDISSVASDDTLQVIGIQNHPVAATSPTSGQIMGYNGSQWAPTNADFIRSGGDVLTGAYAVDGAFGVVSTTATNADAIPLMAIRRQTTHASNGADGLGSMILFEAENSAGSVLPQSAILSNWTTATTATEQSQLEFQTRFNTSVLTRMTITASGKVGIGTTSPNAMLDVQGTIKLGTNGAATSCSSIETGVLRYNSNQLEACNGTIWQASGYWSQEGSDGYYNTSNIAIGTSDVNSLYRLNIESSANHLAYLKQNSSILDGLLIETTGNSIGNFGLSVGSGGLPTFVVKNDNRVGINLFMPEANFHVSGTTLLAGKATVSGVIQLRSLASLPNACSTDEEGAQRYNGNFKVMEFCNGESWQGLNGVTNCDSGYTLVGTPGNPNAYCIENTPNTSVFYTDANSNCVGKSNNRRTAPAVCTTKQMDRACEADTPLSSLLNVYHWTSDGYNASGTNSQMVVVKYVSSTGSCHLSDGGTSNTGRNAYSYAINTGIVYRCCYQ